GKYSTVLTNPETGFSFTPPAAVLSGPVVVSQQPRSQAVSPGSNVIFRVAASGFGSLSYQWQFNGENLAGATNDTLAIISAQLANEGAYRAAVSNHYGTVQSS